MLFTIVGSRMGGWLPAQDELLNPRKNILDKMACPLVSIVSFVSTLDQLDP